MLGNPEEEALLFALSDELDKMCPDVYKRLNLNIPAKRVIILLLSAVIAKSLCVCGREITQAALQAVLTNMSKREFTDIYAQLHTTRLN